MLTLPKYTLKEYIYRYEECKNRKVFVGCLIATPLDSTVNTGEVSLVGVGLSQCHDTDKFDKEEATKIAFNRARLFTGNYKIHDAEIYTCLRGKDPFGDRNEDWAPISGILKSFLFDRCIPYYKDKLVIFPRIEFF